jgi:acyl carrier protein
MMAMPDNGPLLAIFASVFPDIPADNLPSLSLVSHPGWDSLATVTLIAVLEDEYAITIQPSEIEQIVSFELIASLVAEKLE